MKHFLHISLCVLGALVTILLAAGCISAPPDGTGAVPAGTTTFTVNTTSTTIPATASPSPSPTAMFSDAIPLKGKFSFLSGDMNGEATVYRYWLNDTYHWRNPMDNKDYVQAPPTGYRYLIIFVNIVNRGDTRLWPPSSGAIHLWYAGNEYHLDPDHYLPGTSGNGDDTPIAIQEIQYLQQLYSMDRVSDYGYSHGQKLGAVYPGESNALDGYLIYVVPKSLTPDQAYVQVAFTGKDTGVWKLA